MLNILRRIVQEVNAAGDLDSAANVLVSRVQKAMNTEVCSVYLIDKNTNRFVLRATEGLHKEAVGVASQSTSEGLLGLVTERAETVNLENMESHPKFQLMKGTGEEHFSSFLCVPIIHQRKVLGVISLQQKQKRKFDEGEEAFMITLSAQLAAVIAHAEATGMLEARSRQKVKQAAKWEGVAGAPGVVIGKGVVRYPTADLDSIPFKKCADPDAEITFFEKAISAVRDDIENLGDQLADRLSREEKDLFDAYARMLDDNALGIEVKKLIHKGYWAQGALAQVILKYANHFELMEDSYISERAADVKDLGRRVLTYLQKATDVKISYPSKSILLAEELTASMLAEVPQKKLVGLISVRGSINSHAAILARAMGIPTVVGAVDIPITQLDGHELIVDGYEGQVFSNVTGELRKHYKQIVREEAQLIAGLETLRDLPSITKDEHRLPLWVNTGLLSDVTRSLEHGAEGVGLYRTEVPFMLKERFPSEQEQKNIYQQQLVAFAPKQVTMRTLDIGGDKSLPYFPINEENPFLGWRGIRVSLDHPEIYLVQVRAMMKASEGMDNLSIMLPMISNISEVEVAYALVERAYMELVDEGYEIKMPPVGVMMEVPAVVYQIREIARKVDFVSVGSNDLTQYLLAVDRNNPRVASLYNSYHPAVLQALSQIVEGAHHENIPVSICGEIAGDPGAAALLMAMGFDVLSMNASMLPRVKAVIRQLTLLQAQQLLSEVLTMSHASDIRNHVDKSLSEMGIDRLLRPGRSTDSN